MSTPMPLKRHPAAPPRPLRAARPGRHGALVCGPGGGSQGRPVSRTAVGVAGGIAVIATCLIALLATAPAPLYARHKIYHYARGTVTACSSDQISLNVDGKIWTFRIDPTKVQILGGAPAVGLRAKVKYFVDTTGTMWARRITIKK